MSQNRSSAVMQQRSEPHNSLDDFPTPPWATRALCEWLQNEWDELPGGTAPAWTTGRMTCRETDAILVAYGSVPVAGIRQRHIEADLDKLPPNPANARLKAWRLIFRTARRASHRR